MAAVFLSTFRPAAAQPAKPAGYAGSDTCSACHADLFKSFEKNPHHQVETQKRRQWQGMACESCHGPGAKHAETLAPADILNPAKQPPAAADRNCLKCHLNQITQVGRVQGSHALNMVGCTSCHSVHMGSEELRPAKASEINEKCAKCHSSTWAEFQRPHTHPLRQGAMSCVDCHNPHGSSLPRSIRTVSANEPNCFKCHGNLRGPFTFEHAPVKVEGCRTCHIPHGSANPRMLTRAEVRFVCMECHSNIPATIRSSMGGLPPAFHDLRSARFRNCTICHTKVHGSYVEPSLER